MTQEAEQLVADMAEAIEKLDDTRMMEVVGVAQALAELRSSLDGVDELLNERRFEEASARGYRDVSSNFIFLQRTLAALQAAEFKKHELVQTVALKAKLSYEEAAPFVECKLKSSIPREPGQTMSSREEVKKRLRERFGHSLE